jgi:hypothetical protein
LTLRLTEPALAAAYSFLRELPPFKGWKLPPASRVRFKVMRTPAMYADFSVEDGVPIIRVSGHGMGHTATVLADIAHEIIHLHQYLTKQAGGSDHNADFKRRAKRICAMHGFDPRTF